MNPRILKEFPLVKKYFDQARDMGGPMAPGAKPLQERAIELIHQDGGCTDPEKEASMIAAALILDPMSLYADIGRFWDGYSDEVGDLINTMMSTRPDTFMPAPYAQATAAAGIAVMEDMTAKIRRGDKLGAPPREILEKMKEAYGQDMELFAYLDAPKLLEKYEAARNTVFAALEARLGPPPRPPKPGNGSFDF